MSKEKSKTKDLYYTNDNEWIDFQGTVAYIGICAPKLIACKEIHEINFIEPSGFKKRGDIITTIKYHELAIEVHMPVDGTIVQVNDALLCGQVDILLQQPENDGWIALIVPSQPYERKDLLMPKQYQMNTKNKYAK